MMRRSWVLLVTLATLLTGLAVLAAPPRPAAAAGVQLYEGGIQYSTIVNCQSIIWGTPYPEAGIGTYTGFYADPETGQPGVNQTYYLEVHVAGMGNSCGGQRFGVDLLLPANTTLAISGTAPVLCYADTTLLSTAECPQALPASGIYPGAYWFPSVDTAHGRSWPMPQGRTWTFRIPVRSSTTLTGSNFKAYVQVADGWGNPVLEPTVGVYVFNGSSTSILYPSPSTEFTPVPNSGNFTVKSTAYIYKPYAQTGTVYFDIATSPTFTTVLFTDSGAVPANQQALLAWTDWVPGGPSAFAIQPNTTYYWRARYAPSGGGQVVGATQTFVTPSNGNNVVGNGTAASCTLAALKAAFNPYTQKVVFDCGPSPVTFQLDSSYITGGPLEIDGGGKVTLVAKPGTRIFKHDGGNLVLKGLTLTGGTAANDCGGAVQIFNGTATFSKVRISNSSAGWGGGVCAMTGTTLDMYDSAVTGNTASDGGGGVYAGGNTSIWRSDVSGNTANTYGGGGVYADATYLDVFFSSLTGNTANGATYGRGGGLLVESATYGTITTSTVSGNTAVRGGGIHNEGTGTYVTNATIAFNTSTGAGRGGGIESETTGNPAAMYLRNTIVANNTTNGTSANCAGTAAYRQFISQGTNLVSDVSCNFNAAGDLQNTDPKLRPLSQNGGGTRTHAIPISSPALEAANNPYCGMFDQRGVSGPSPDVAYRPIDSDGNGSQNCDIGAYELQAGPVFAGISPARLLESRPANGTVNPVTGISSNTLLTVDGESQNLGPRAAGSVTELRVAGRAGVPADALAASLNVTATGATSGGWVTVFPCGTTMPSTSTLNLQAGVTVANAATIALGVDGKVCVYVSAATNVIVDINGYMPAASRYGALRPSRIMDTRTSNGATDDGIAQRTGALAANTPRELQVSGRGGVPVGAAAVVLNVTATNATGTTFVTVYPCGAVPSTSNLNLGAGSPAANAVFVGLNGAGKLCVTANSSVDVIVDVVGYLPAGTTMTALSPARLLDSRPGQPNPPDDGVNTVRPAGSVTELQVTNRGGVSGSATSVVLNVTAVGAAANGYLTVYPCDQAQPNASNLNYVAGVNRANLVVVRVPTTGPKTGKVCLFTSQQTNLLADVLGQVT